MGTARALAEGLSFSPVTPPTSPPDGGVPSPHRHLRGTEFGAVAFPVLRRQAPGVLVLKLWQRWAEASCHRTRRVPLLIPSPQWDAARRLHGVRLKDDSSQRSCGTEPFAKPPAPAPSTKFPRASVVIHLLIQK